MNIYGIYDLSNKEQCVTVGTVDEIMKFLGLTPRAFTKVMRAGNYKDRYLITYVYNEDQDIINSKINIDMSRFKVCI